MSDPYAELAELAERELELAAGGRVEQLAELQRRAAALAARLPATPPPHARAALERAARAQHAAAAALADALAETEDALARLRRGRAGVKGYAANLGSSPTLDRAG